MIPQFEGKRVIGICIDCKKPTERVKSAYYCWECHQKHKLASQKVHAVYSRAAYDKRKKKLDDKKKGIYY